MPTYHISDQKEQPNVNNRREDKSFKSCVCLLLIFIALCGILFFASSFLKKSAKSLSDNESEVEVMENYEIKHTKLKPNEKLVEFTTEIVNKEIDATDISISNVDITETITEDIDITKTSTLFEEDDRNTDKMVSEHVIELTTTVGIDLVDEETTEKVPSTTNAQNLTQANFETTTSVLPQTETLSTTLTSTTPINGIFNVTLPPEMRREASELPQTETWSTTSTSTTPVNTQYDYSMFNEQSIYVTLPSEMRLEASASPLTSPTCSSNRCKSMASNILYLIDPAQDPCEDFYGFACGGLEGSTKTQNNEQARIRQVAKGIFNEIDKVKIEKRSEGIKGLQRYYEVCVKAGFEEEHGGKFKTVLNLLTSMNLHQFAAADASENSFDWTRLFEKMILMQVLPIFDVNVGLGLQSGTKFRLELSPPPLYSSSSILLDEDIYTNSNSETPLTMSAQMLLLRRRCFADLEERVENIYDQNVIDFNKKNGTSKPLYDGKQERLECMSKYRAGAFIESLWKVCELFLETRNDVPTSTDIETGVKQDVLTLLADMDKLFVYSDSVDAGTTITSVYELEIEFPRVKWVELFSKLTSKTFNQNSKVYLNHPQLLQKMLTYIQKLPSYKIYNTLLAIFARDLYVNLVEPRRSQISLRSHCQIEAISLFPHIASTLYIKSVNLLEQEAMDEYLEDIFTQLKKNLTSNLQSANWLDEHSKTSCVSALDEITLYLANDDLTLAENEMNNLYDNINITESYCSNFVHMVWFKRNLNLALYDNEFNTKYFNGYLMNSYDVNPKSIFSENTIAIPVGMVDIYKPFSTSMPRFFAMAKIGIHVAIEIGKRFDSIGITQGISLSGTSKPSYDAFKEFTKVQYSPLHRSRKINGKDVLHTIKSEMSLNSRISDSAGFRLILDALPSYQEQDFVVLPWLHELYSKEQIYIISAIQEFCEKKSFTEYLFEMFESSVLPPALRVENMVANTLQFAEAFKCPEGTQMNSPIKLQFPYIATVEAQDYVYEDDNFDKLL